LYTENYITLLKKFKENINKWKDILWSWTERLKMSILPKVIYRFNATSIKIPKFQAEVEVSILKLIWNSKGHWMAKTVLKKNKVGVCTFSDFKTYYTKLHGVPGWLSHSWAADLCFGSGHDIEPSIGLCTKWGDGLGFSLPFSFCTSPPTHMHSLSLSLK